MAEIFLVRQPVFDRADAAVGYELRFRDGADGEDPIARSFISGAFDVVRGGLPAYIRATRGQLVERVFAVPDPRSLVVLLPSIVEPDGDLFDAVSALTRHGVALGLDDFTLPREAGSPVLEFLALARIVRVDLRDQDPGALAPMVSSLRKLGKRVVADQVIDSAMYKACLSAGFDAFQGTHFARPEPLPAAEIPTSTATALRLMALARDMNTPERELEQVISADPGIAFQLLRIVNSAALGGRGITSIGHALRLVGRNNVIRWLALASYTSRAGKSGVDDELVRQAVQRAHFCEAMVPAGRGAAIRPRDWHRVPRGTVLTPRRGVPHAALRGAGAGEARRRGEAGAGRPRGTLCPDDRGRGVV